MLFLKTCEKWGNGPTIWCDANESIDGLIKAYPQSAGIGTRQEQIRELMRKDFIKRVYAASYCAVKWCCPTDEEKEMIQWLPASMKVENGPA